MTRSSLSVSALRKIYDDAYLLCTTAVYWEQQLNEEEALKCWKNARDQIAYHRYASLTQYRPKTEVEKTLVHTLNQLETQCDDRIRLLDALKESKKDTPGRGLFSFRSSSASSANSHSNSLSPSSPRPRWLGDGTLPPLSIPDLPTPRPPLPRRAGSNEMPLLSSSIYSSSLLRNESTSHSTSPDVQRTRSAVSADRTSSPEKPSTGFKFRTTLRDEAPTAKKSFLKRDKTAQNPLAASSKAASQAWTSSWALNSSTTRPPDTSHETRDPELAASVARLALNSWPPSLPGPQSIDRANLPQRDLWSGFNGSWAAEDPRRLNSAIPAAAAGLASNPVPPHPPPHRSQNPSASHTFRRPLNSLGSSSRAALGRDTARRKPVIPEIPKKSTPSPETYPYSSNLSNPPLISTFRSPSELRGASDESSSTRNYSSILEAGIDVSPEPDGRPQSPSTIFRNFKDKILNNLPRGVDEHAATQILNDILITGDEVRWSDIAGLNAAKNALKENVVYPFWRPDMFVGLREPARGMLLFGPPGTGKTMLARAVATESRSTFFAISASSLVSKFLGDSEKLVKALFTLAKLLAPSIIFVDEIDSLLASRESSGEHEASRRIKTEFLIQWSDLARAAAGREPAAATAAAASSSSGAETLTGTTATGDPSRVLVLAATNAPWAIDEAARRRFVRRQYIPLPEAEIRKEQLTTLLAHQKKNISDKDLDELVELTEGFSGSDITALAKDAAMGPLRCLGDKLLVTSTKDIRPIGFEDFVASLQTIKPSVSKAGLQQFEDWAKEYGERGG